jgi:hypothetical protein
MVVVPVLTMTRLGTLLAGVVAIPFLLVGCAAPEPAPRASSPSPSPSASAQPPSEPATLVIGAVDLKLLAEGGEMLETLPFAADGSTAVAFLERAFGEAPALSATPSDGNCARASSHATWGDWFALAYDIQGETSSGLQMQVTSEKELTPNGLAVQTPSGFGVGDDIAALMAAQPEADTDGLSMDGVEYLSVFYDVGAGTPADGEAGEAWWGASAAAEDGVIRTLRSPHAFRDSC